MALQYPLLFPYGEDGYRIGISHRNPETGSYYRRKTVTMRQYYSFRLQHRAGEAQTLLWSGRLFQQYMVDAYASIEEVRINWIRKNQKKLRAELYNGLRYAINQGDVMTNSVGRMTIIPLSYTGGLRYRVQNYQDEIMYTVEFQKRGLPHAHILVFLHSEDKIQIPSKIDVTISAEVPDKDIDPLTFSAVERFMIHGPCGILNKKSSCMVNGKCGMHYPKRFHDKTSIDEDEYPIYMRQNGGQYILKNGSQLDSQYVVPYNRHLLIKYDAHINVEVCNHSRSIKYLFKYINKGPDRVRAVISNVENFDNSSTSSMHFRDEIKVYLDCRYISPSEASWRIFKFNMFFREPVVKRLSFHLHGQQTIYFSESMRISTILNREGIETTMFIEWMKMNSVDMEARQLTYVEFPTKYVWNKTSKKWTRRKNGRCAGRIYYVPPTSGENFYLRMLLNKVRRSRSFEDIKIVNGFVHLTCKDACYALGLLEDDKEFDDCIKEAAAWGLLLESNSKLLSEDILYKQCRLLNFPDLHLSYDQLKNYALSKIQKHLRKVGKSLEDYKGMAIPNSNVIEEANNRLITEELNYDMLKMHEEYSQLLHGLNSDQKTIHDFVLRSITLNFGKLFFVYGSSGTGKTYLWRTLLAKLRSEGKIALAVATSGIIVETRLLLDVNMEECLQPPSFLVSFTDVFHRVSKTKVICIQILNTHLIPISEHIKGDMSGHLAEVFPRDGVSFSTTCENLLPRPWIIDDLDTLKLKWSNKSWKKVIIFIDNSGGEIILGILPFARELL
ncbi:uncharacterized protein [Cicer arietinum]|uniref:uncharacterized protein n=1 Tax=Cicer arietinum TaxID=3827 RepID=UPI003CC60505